MKVITIGRDPSCSIVINDPQISRRHAIVRVSDFGKIEIVDLSSNGTSVNGNPLRKNVPCPVTRKNQVTFAGVSKLNWDDIPNPLRRYKWIGLGILGIIALAIIITLVANHMNDNESIEIPATTVIQEQGATNTGTAKEKESPTKIKEKGTKSTNNDEAVNDDDYRHLLKPVDKPHHHANPSSANAEDNKTNKTDAKAKDKPKQTEKKDQTSGNVKTKTADNSAKSSASNESSGEQNRKKDKKL